MIGISISIFLAWLLFSGWWLAYCVALPLLNVFRETPKFSAAQALLLALGLTVFGYALVLEYRGSPFAVFLFLTPILLYASISVITLKLYGAMFSTLAILIISWNLLSKASPTKRFYIAVVTSVLLVVLPPAIQNPLSNKHIQNEFSRMEGDCLSYRSFYSSLLLYGVYSQPSHAVMIKDGKVYAWSYHLDRFEPIPEDQQGRIYLAPDNSCRSSSNQ